MPRPAHPLIAGIGAVLSWRLSDLNPERGCPKGILGGLQTGYNYQVDGVVFGVEADYAWANMSDSSSRTLHSEFNIPGEPGFGVTTNMKVRQELDSLATLRARLGFTPVDQVLLYVTGGLALGRASSSIDVSQFETGPFCSTGIAFTPSSGSRSSTLTGWTAGGGGEWALAPNVSAKVEYLHYDLGTMHYSANQITDTSAPCAGSMPFASVKLAPSAEFKGDLVRVGLNFKIGQ